MLENTPARTAGAPLVGVDVGGTKTHIVSDQGIDSIVLSSDWRHGAIFDHDENFARLARLVAAVVGAEPAVTVLGLHGIDNAAQRRRATRMLQEHVAGRAVVINDALLLGPAMGVDEAICVIAGTGSVIVGVDSDGETIAADGHGWLIADDASAPGLTRQAALRLLREVDRVGSPALEDPLARRLLHHFEVDDHVDLALRLHADSGDIAWGRFAPHVFAAAHEGSVLASAVIRDSGAHLAAMIQAVRGRGAVGTDVIVAGGVITAQPLLVEALRTALAEPAPELRVRVLDVAPVTGALALARRLHAEDLVGS